MFGTKDLQMRFPELLAGVANACCPHVPLHLVIQLAHRVRPAGRDRYLQALRRYRRDLIRETLQGAERISVKILIADGQRSATVQPSQRTGHVSAKPIRQKCQHVLVINRLTVEHVAGTWAISP